MPKVDELYKLLENELKRVTKKASILEYDNHRLIEAHDKMVIEIKELKEKLCTPENCRHGH